jgi:hypothetical protein
MTRADRITMLVPTQISIFDNNNNNSSSNNINNSFPGSTCRSRAIIRFPTCPISHKCVFPPDLPRSWGTMTKEVVAAAEWADEVVDVVVDEEEAAAEEAAEGEVEAEEDILAKAMLPMTLIGPSMVLPMTLIGPSMVRMFHQSNSSSNSTSNTRPLTWVHRRRRILNSTYRVWVAKLTCYLF